MATDWIVVTRDFGEAPTCGGSSVWLYRREHKAYDRWENFRKGSDPVDFSRVLHAAIGLLVMEGRLSYRRLQAEFDLNDTQFEAIRFELTEVRRLAVDQDGVILVWAGDGERARGSGTSAGTRGTPPASRLAEPAAHARAAEVVAATAPGSLARARAGRQRRRAAAADRDVLRPGRIRPRSRPSSTPRICRT